MATSITLTFNFQPAIDTQLIIVDSLRQTINMLEVFKAARAGIGTVSIGINVDLTLIHYQKAFNGDYNNSLLYIITYDIAADTVTITAINTSTQFSVSSNTTAGAITTSINNETIPTVFDFTTIVASEAATTPCNNVKLTSTLSEQADTINSPISQAVGANPFVFETVRGNAISLQFQKGSNIITKLLRIPQLLSTYFNIDIINTPSNASITVERLFPLTDAVTTELFPLTFQYSLNNNTDWQTSNAWSGVVPGNHTMYVKDNLGCEINFPFTIDVFTPNLVDFDAVAEISKLNAIPFKKNEAWDDVTIFKNPNNTLSSEERDIKPIEYPVLVQKNDTKTTQIKTNYATQVATLIDCQGNETSLTVTKKTANMNITDVRDVHATNINSGNYSGRLGVYYGSGNTYDSTTLVQNGTYNLGTILPSWVNIGDYISLQGFGYVLIEDIIDFNGNKTIITNALFIDSTFTEAQTIQGTSVYNQLDFERYEFTIPFASYEGYYKVKVNLTDANFPAVEFLSEWMNIQTLHKNCYLIDYYNTENNEINYSTGIVHRLRVPYEQTLKWKPNVEQDIYVSNTDTISLKNKVREFYDFWAAPLPTFRSQQLVLILGQDRLQIDGENFVLEAEPESESLEDTNLYELKATLVKANYVFNSNSGVNTGEIIIPTGSPLAIDENASGFLLAD
jgi:hypothetical protein